jgi:hypothetical protein
MAYDSARDLSEESRIWESGLAAPQASGWVTNKTRRFPFRTSKLDVTYIDAAGKHHRHEVEIDTIWGSIDGSKRPVVRYLPEHADRFAVSWAVEARASRIANVVALGVLGVGLVAAAFGVIGIGALRRLSLARRRAFDSEEVVVRITKVEPKAGPRGYAGDVYHYAGKTADGRELSGKESFRKNEEPLFADASRTTIVVLVDPLDPGPALVVRQDFRPFVLTPEEESAVRAAIAGRGSG